MQAQADPNWLLHTLVTFVYLLEPVLLSAGLLLGICWLVLCFRNRPLFEHLAFIAAALYPALLGLLGGLVLGVEMLNRMSNGSVGPESPAQYYARTIGMITGLLITGAAETLFFLTLGILTLLVRRPK